MGSDLCCWLAKLLSLQYNPLPSLQLEVKAILVGPCGPSAPVLVVAGGVLLVFTTCTHVHHPPAPLQLPALQALGSGILPRSSNLPQTVSAQIAAINVDDTGPDGSVGGTLTEARLMRPLSLPDWPRGQV